MKLNREEQLFMMIAYIVAILGGIILIIDFALGNALPTHVKIVFGLGVFCPLLFRVGFHFKSKARHMRILKNRAELFKEIPKEEVFASGVFVDNFDE